MKQRTRYITILVALVISMHASFAVAPAAAHDNAGCQWDAVGNQELGYNFYIKWWYNSGAPFWDEFKERIWDGATRWNQVDRDLQFGVTTPSDSSSDIELQMQPMPWFQEHLLAAAYWQCGPIRSATIRFNSEYQSDFHTSTDPPPQYKYDVWTLAAHEFGHLVSLYHSGASADVMWEYVPDGTSRRTLTYHDEQGIMYLYGPSQYAGN